MICTTVTRNANLGCFNFEPELDGQSVLDVGEFVFLVAAKEDFMSI